jgi:uncharacterized protein YcbK (DUF882 family)
MYFTKKGDPRLFFCSETGEEGIKPYFLEALNDLRDVCGFPFIITSGYRSPNHSVERRKSKPGTHAQGIAADIAVDGGMQRYEIVEKAMYMGIFGGIGVAERFVHVDVRDGPRVMWTYSNQ